MTATPGPVAARRSAAPCFSGVMAPGVASTAVAQPVRSPSAVSSAWGEAVMEAPTTATQRGRGSGRVGGKPQPLPMPATSATTAIPAATRRDRSRRVGGGGVATSTDPPPPRDTGSAVLERVEQDAELVAHAPGHVVARLVVDLVPVVAH